MTYNINTDGPEVITFPSVIFATFLIVGLVTDRALMHTLGFYGYPHPLGWSFIILGILQIATLIDHSWHFAECIWQDDCRIARTYQLQIYI